MRHVFVALLIALLLVVRTTGTAAAGLLQLGSSDGARIAVDGDVLFHTLVSDYFPQPDGTMYVQTGDIPAMWLRDAAAQTLPYVRFAKSYPALATWVRGVIEREARNILVDPYANAFTDRYGVWERKWEVDSLAYPMVLSWAYYVSTRDHRMFTPRLHEAMERIVATYACEQQHASCSRYHFPGVRPNDAPATGMIWSAFRPSDDPVQYGFNIPQEMLAVTALSDLGALAIAGFGDHALAAKAAAIAAGVRAGIERYGVVYNFKYGRIYAYEVDGRGGIAMMDDANMPNLLSAPLFGFLDAGDPVYDATRRFVLSPDNPYYYRGRVASGLGSPHTPANWVWPLGIIAQGLTASSASAMRAALYTLSATDSDDGLIHESFDADDDGRYTRAEFGWANAMYAEIVFRSATDLAAPDLFPRDCLLCLVRSTGAHRIVNDLARAENTAGVIAAFERAVPLLSGG